jgi:hypothetical protein
MKLAEADRPGNRLLDPNPDKCLCRHAGEIGAGLGGGAPLAAAIGAELRDRARRGPADQGAAQLDARGQAEAGKPAKLLPCAARALIRHGKAEPSNIDPSNMPEHAPEKRLKSAISARATGSAPRALVELRRAGRRPAQRRDRGPKLSPSTPTNTPQSGISGLYFIRRAARGLRAPLARPCRFPSSQRQRGRERAQKRANSFIHIDKRDKFPCSQMKREI